MSKRFKIRYTIDEITNNLYTSGKEYMTVDNVQYIGLYHRYSTGEIFTLSKWNASKSKKLIPYKELTDSQKSYNELKPKIQTSYSSVTPLFLEISQQNIIDGYIDRYFLQNIVSKKIIEISKTTNDKLSKKIIDPNLYTSVELRWYITGDKFDKTENGVLIQGVQTKNINEIRIAARTISDISQYLNNELEYYSDTTYIIPRDINKLDN
jgi:hypothetical protein